MAVLASSVLRGFSCESDGTDQIKNRRRPWVERRLARHVDALSPSSIAMMEGGKKNPDISFAIRLNPANVSAVLAVVW